MAKSKSESNGQIDLRKALSSKYGKSYFVGDVPSLERIPTKIIGLDRILGGGLPVGRIIQIVAPSSAGKTTTALQMVRAVQEAGYECAYADLERTIDDQRLTQLGIDKQKLHLVRPASGTKALDFAVDCAEFGIKLIVVDSVPFLTPEPKPGQEVEIGDVQMAPQARLLSQAQPIIVPAVEHNGATLLFINQIRNKIGGYGNPTTYPGGLALRFMCSTIVEISRKEVHKDGSGLRIQLKTVKNKTHSEGLTCEVDLLYKSGIDAYSSMKELLEKEGYLSRRGSYYYWSEELAQHLGLADAKIGLGSKSVIGVLQSKPELYDYLYEQLVVTSGDDLDPAPETAEASADPAAE